MATKQTVSDKEYAKSQRAYRAALERNKQDNMKVLKEWRRLNVEHLCVLKQIERNTRRP
jgi:hypothetical protein